MTHDRDTYLPARDLIARAAEYSSKIENYLGQLHGLSSESRAALMQNAFNEEQAKLTSALRHYAHEAAPKILDTFAQASIPVPEAFPEPVTPLTPDALTQWMLEVNRPLIALFAEAADAVEATPAHDAFDNLAELVRHHEMRIVQAADGASDL